ncbi:hypothetical protein QBZ16_000386 [Prototheca wickerhamii]|uniref:Uncharacterized protein n=1 Tax=Prototheca wickerhamii TaxID=3111 RepID=A0AAD9IMQ5_PROWI|nr:hypothetical protein QBZ16_000386 [Prototheca wickerhamii]
MQVSVEQIWESFWNFGSGSCPEPVSTVPNSDKAVPKADVLGLDIWPGALALCNYLAVHRGLVHGRRAIELGAGMGLPGLLAGQLGARECLLTDYEPLVLDLLKENVKVNSLEGPCAVHALDWAEPGSTMDSRDLHTFNVVLAADVLYISDIVLPFVAVLQALLHPEGIALIGHQTRRPLALDPETGVPTLSERDQPFESFLESLKAAGLVHRVLGSLDAGGSAGPLFLLAIAWDETLVAALEPVPPLETP